MQRLFNLSLSNKTKPLILLFAASFIFVLLVLIQIEPYVYWWTVVSAYNIEAARNFAATGDFYISTKIGTLDEQTPIMNWPPGDPFIISLLSIITGVKIKWLTVFLSVICWIVVPIVIYFLLLPISGRVSAVCISLITLTSPGLLYFGWRGLSDTPFLLCTLLGFYFSIYKNSAKWQLLNVFLGGMLLGIAFSIRNLGAAAVFAVFTVLLLSLMGKRGRTKTDFIQFIAWGAGASAIVIPYMDSLRLQDSN